MPAQMSYGCNTLEQNGGGSGWEDDGPHSGCWMAPINGMPGGMPNSRLLLDNNVSSCGADAIRETTESAKAHAAAPQVSLYATDSGAG
jgi:hypothetical protein